MAAVQPIYWQTTAPKYGDRVSKIATSGRFPYTCILTFSTRHLPFDHYRKNKTAGVIVGKIPNLLRGGNEWLILPIISASKQPKQSA
jgi:hypothetical protein